MWPNWVDLLIITLFLRTCYSGFGRGFLAEVLNLLGAVTVTVVAVNTWSPLARWLKPWLQMKPTLGTFIVFGLLFLGTLVLVRMGINRLTELIKWERLHWAIQGLGMILGGLRGLWWAGLILLICASSGFGYLRESVETESILGPRLVGLSREGLGRIADRFPGSQSGRRVLIPPMRSRDGR